MAYIQSITTTDSQTYDIKSKVTAAIPYGECDSTSTATEFTATVDGITALYDGVCVMLKNGVVTSAANFTININNLGAKPCYNNMATGNDITPTDPVRDTTIFNQNYTMLLVYSTEIVSGGGWICYRGYDGGGSGGVSITNTTVTIAVANWSNGTCTKSVAGVTASNTVVVTYAPASKAVYTAADIYCTAQDSGTLTFACTTTPTAAVTVNVMVIDGAVTPVPPVTTYSISGVSHAYKTCTQSGSYYEVSDEITEAAEGETVYISVSSAIGRISSSPSVTFTYVGMKSGTSGALGIYSFVMPASNITITLSER